MLNGSYADSNFMGTGKRVAFELNTGKYAKVFSYSDTNQYLTINNISRTYSMRYSDVTQFVSASSDFSSKSISGGLEFGYPISEIQGLRVGMNVTRSELLTTSAGSALQAQTAQQNGKPYSRSAVTTTATSSSSSQPLHPSHRPPGTRRARTAAVPRLGPAAVAVALLEHSRHLDRVLGGGLPVRAVRPSGAARPAW
jgi:outer membrane protein assembly factor BamA